MVDDIGQIGGKGSAEAEGGGEPLGEGADVRAEEGVDGVGESVVRTEAAVGDGREGQARAHGVHQVRSWAWHGSLASVSSAARNTSSTESLSQRWVGWRLPWFGLKAPTLNIWALMGLIINYLCDIKIYICSVRLLIFRIFNLFLI